MIRSLDRFSGAFGEVQGFIDAVRTSRSRGQVEMLLEQIARDMGFDFYALIHHVDHRDEEDATSIRMENYPPGWVELFLEKELYTWDPIHLASRRTNTVFAWSNVSKMIPFRRLHAEVLDAAACEGLGDGLTVPLHLPNETSASCSFAVRQGRNLPSGRELMVQLIGTFAFEAARRLATTKSVEGRSKVALTARQLECTVLAGQGKSDAEIAQALKLKQDTVAEHLDAARSRYKAPRRIQLVLRALQDGHIQLNDLLP